MELAGALMRRRQCHEQITATLAAIDTARASQLLAAATELLAHQRYIERMEETHRLLLGQLAKHDQEVADGRANLVARSQDRQALEKLKEIGLEAHTRELARSEQMTLDEIAGIGHWRRAA